MNRTLWLLPVLVLTSFNLAEAQQPKKVPRIGYLSTSSPTVLSARLYAFRQILHDFEYVEGRTLSLSGDLPLAKRIGSLRSPPGVDRRCGQILLNLHFLLPLGFRKSR